MSKYLSLLAFVLLSSSASAKQYGDISAVTLSSVYDGDTFRVHIENWPTVIGENTPVRIKGVDTPELRAKCPSEKNKAKQAKQFTEQLLKNAERIELRNVERGKYFRLLADVYVNGENLAELLIQHGYGYAYHGGARKSWCAVS
ncbi:thermonuclease family protein [Thalassotalea ponticola]|uniref:thermonuclease family protein n=1 Tax=Thalassotalea ponticola TaxID=1523392 RepID=UPI0025B2C0B1|nr:thermonuclease family protein [Thalassotalea ponticola]MDN3652441.1 thermonuclease family protein [Thalassotalea ponticola]